MFIATHKKIADTAYEMFSPQLKELISKKAFIEGSHYPDTNLKYTIISHKFEPTIGIVKEKLDEILKKKHKKKALSKKLGIICHFVADYCSPYHVNDKYKDKNILIHLKYERITNKAADYITIQEDAMQNDLFFNVYTLEEDLTQFIQKHMQGDRNIIREVRLSIINTLHIINLIMAEYTEIHINQNNIAGIMPMDAIPAAAYYPPAEGIAAMCDKREYFEAN